MRLIQQSTRTAPKISLILLDWSVRESFHVLEYLRQQTIPRDAFEVIVVEYYSTVSPAVQRFADQVDTWALLDMPASAYYHKHLMYNAGIMLAHGDIVVIKDSDAMVRDNFLARILDAFAADPGIVFHIDQFRNNRRDLYPFAYPDFETVTGPGCINSVNGKTAGLVETADPLHMRNYGACMCARRDDLIAIGGADEHIDFLGHVCGPYDMTFRLVNHGRREVWADDTFSYHTWHPGQAGEDNYLGPHDGRHVSTTSLQALLSGRVLPLVENPAIRAARLGAAAAPEALMERLIRPGAPTDWEHARLDGHGAPVCPVDTPNRIGTFLGTPLYQDAARFTVGTPPFARDAGLEARRFASAAEAVAAVAEALPPAWRRRVALVRSLSRHSDLALRIGRRLLQLRLPSPARIWRHLTRRPAAHAAAPGHAVQWTEAADLDNLVIAFLAAARDHAPPPELAVTSPPIRLALRLAMLTGLLPAAPVRVVGDSADARRLVAERTTLGRPVLMQGLAYLRYYPILHGLVGHDLVLHPPPQARTRPPVHRAVPASR